jgi:pimeloyl-ACP methyl ester carboxylesterase
MWSCIFGKLRDVLIVLVLFPVFCLRGVHHLLTRSLLYDSESAIRVDSFYKEFAEYITLIEIRPGRWISVLHIPSRDRPHASRIVFVHGACARMQQFEHQIRHFSRLGFEIVAYDALGCGESDKPYSSNSYSLTEMYADLSALITQYSSSSKCILIGHSMGGAMVNRIASVETARDLIRCAVVIAPPFCESAESLRSRVRLLTLPIPLLWLIRPYFSHQTSRLLFGPSVDLVLVAQEREASGRNPIYMFRAFYSGLQAELLLFKNLNPTLEIPVLYIAAAHDKICPDVKHYSVYFRQPDSEESTQLIVCPVSGHQVMQEQPGWTNEQIEKFLVVH